MSLFNMAYHNLDIVIRNLDLFKKKYTITRSLKINQRRGIYDVIDNFEKKHKVLKFLLKSNVTSDQIAIFHFFMNCNHRNFCRIDEIMDVGLFIVLVMDYIEGEPLCVYFSKEHSRLEYYKILFDLVLSLEFIHSMKIAHGDIKPTNIIVRKDGTPVLIDYDLSRVTSSAHTVKKLFGTKFFMPPELVESKRFSLKSDMWSLGVSFFVCTIKQYVPCVFESFVSSNDVAMKHIINRGSYGISFDQFSQYIEMYDTRLTNTYGKLFVNIIKIMLTIDDGYRPSSDELCGMIKKSKYYKTIYCDNPVVINDRDYTTKNSQSYKRDSFDSTSSDSSISTKLSSIVLSDDIVVNDTYMHHIITTDHNTSESPTMSYSVSSRVASSNADLNGRVIKLAK
jgi:serine/threonine protein kinase